MKNILNLQSYFFKIDLFFICLWNLFFLIDNLILAISDLNSLFFFYLRIDNNQISFVFLFCSFSIHLCVLFNLSVVHARSLTAVSDLKRHGLVCLFMNDNHAALQACDAYIRAFMNRSLTAECFQKHKTECSQRTQPQSSHSFGWTVFGWVNDTLQNMKKKMLGFFVNVKSPWRFLKATKCDTIVNHSHASI